MAPKHATAGSRAHYRPVSAMAPDHTTDGPQRSEYSFRSSLTAGTTVEPLRVGPRSKWPEAARVKERRWQVSGVARTPTPAALVPACCEGCAASATGTLSTPAPNASSVPVRTSRADRRAGRGARRSWRAGVWAHCMDGHPSGSARDPREAAPGRDSGIGIRAAAPGERPLRYCNSFSVATQRGVIVKRVPCRSGARRPGRPQRPAAAGRHL